MGKWVVDVFIELFLLRGKKMATRSIARCLCVLAVVVASMVLVIPMSDADEPMTEVFRVWDAVSVGSFEYRVIGTQWSDKLSDNKLLDSKPDATYFILELQITNISSKPATIPRFRLVDENGSQHASSSKSWRLNEDIQIESLNPSVTTKGFIVFDVPQDLSYTLLVSESLLSSKTASIAVTETRIERERRIADRAVEQQLANREERKEIELKQQIQQAARDAAEAAKWRTWTSNDGKFKLEAKLVSMANSVLKLQKRDGYMISVPLSKLSDEDKAFMNTPRPELKRPSTTRK
jgi:hypothetical protein